MFHYHLPWLFLKNVFFKHQVVSSPFALIGFKKHFLPQKDVSSPLASIVKKNVFSFLSRIFHLHLFWLLFKICFFHKRMFYYHFPCLIFKNVFSCSGWCFSVCILPLFCPDADPNNQLFFLNLKTFIRLFFTCRAEKQLNKE